MDDLQYVTAKKPLVVLKYGGASLATSERITRAAQQIKSISQTKNVIVAVSAMGQTTNELLRMANEVSKIPSRRELDLLLSAGERISMSLLSMALQDQGCPAVSLTGSQAGILTDEDHLNARITEIRPQRIREGLEKGKVVIVAGFQGVSPLTKEVTTLGRGGTDTTAVALAASLGAEVCCILKEVEGLFSADPQCVPEARLIPEVTIEDLMEMTFWGAKLLHYRAVDLAFRKGVPLRIGLSETDGTSPQTKGTLVKGKKRIERAQAMDTNEMESLSYFSINSHRSLRYLSFSGGDFLTGQRALLEKFNEFEMSGGQILRSQYDERTKTSSWLLTGPEEFMLGLEENFSNSLDSWSLNETPLASVSLTCSGSLNPGLLPSLLKNLSQSSIQEVLVSAQTITLVCHQKDREKLISDLHDESCQIDRD